MIDNVYQFSKAKPSNLDLAMGYAAAGIAIFPASHRRKTPLVDDWGNAATTNRAAIRRWWKEHPDAAVGLPTGKRNGIAVLDIDSKNGKDGAATLEAMGIDVHSYVSVRTPSGGQHLIFEHEDGLRNTQGRLPNGDRAPGVDVRGDGGYIIAPGSRMAGGATYKYASRATLTDNVIGLASWPKGLAPAPRRETDWDQHRAEYHPSLTLKDGRQILAELPDWWAEERDQWRNTGMAVKDEYGDEGFELWDEWSRQCPEKYDRQKLIGQWRSFKSNARNPITMASLIAEAPEWRDRQHDREIQAAIDELEDLPPLESFDAKHNRGLLTFTTPGQIEEIDSRPYVVKGLIAERDIACIVGAPGVGKSLLAPRIAYAVAQGQNLFGRRVRQGGVFYVAAEDESGMRKRIRALRRRHGDAKGFQLVGGVSDLLAKGSEHLKELRKVVERERPALVVIDTLAMAFPGLEENSAEGMGRVVAVARSLTKWGAAVILIHHDTKDGNQGLPRGHSLLNGALDVSLYLSKGENGIVRGKLSKNRNGACDLDLAFRIGVETLGTDEDGDDITAAYAEELDAAHIEEPRKPAPTRQERQLLTLLEEIAPEGWCERAQWADAATADASIFNSSDRANRQRQFRRASTALADKGHLTIRDDGKVIVTSIYTVNPREFDD